MDIKDFLSPANTFADVHASDKVGLLRELAHRAAWKAGLDGDTVTSEVMKREAVGSTGMGGGIAIPHARIPDLKKPFGLLARLDEAIDFDAVDDHPVDVVFLLLLPDDPHGEQLNALACVARKLRDPKTLEKIRGEGDGAELHFAVTAEHEKPKEA